MSSLGFDRVILEAIGGLPSPDADFVRRTYEMILSEPESGFWKERLSCAIKGDPCSVQAMSAHLIRTRKELYRLQMMDEESSSMSKRLKKKGKAK